MAVVELHPDIPNNIVRLPVAKDRLIREHYERGDLVILSDARIEADFDRIAAAEPVQDAEAVRQKFIFRKSMGPRLKSAAPTWGQFFGDRLETEPDVCRRFQDEVGRVDDQVDALVRRIFNHHEFGKNFTSWKFLEITGENLHIDNLPNLNETTQVRMFVNVDNQPRHWSLGRHWRHYAERHYESAGLAEVAGDAFVFNGKLNHAAFGPSQGTCDEPRHLVVFDPGEVWLLNSALTAHQIRRGRRLCSTQYEYPYGQCIDQAQTLPALIKALGQSDAPEAGKGKPVSALRALLARLTRREMV